MVQDCRYKNAAIYGRDVATHEDGSDDGTGDFGVLTE
jgi:hypothetical protein